MSSGPYILWRMEVDRYIKELTDLHESTQWWRMTSFPQSGQRNLSEEGSCEPESKDMEEPVTGKGREKPSSQTWDQRRGFCGVRVCQDLGEDECGHGGRGRRAGSSQQIEPSWIATAITILKAYYVQGTLRTLTYFILRTALSDRYYSPPHFTDRETEAPRGV